MKTTLKKITLWAVVIISLVSACFLPYLSSNVFAANYYADAKSNIQKAARIQRVFVTAIRCTEGGTIDGHSSSPNPNDPSSMFQDQTWSWSDYDIATGPWLEQLVQGEVDDGAIWCINKQSKSFFTIWAEETGLNFATQIACNGNKPGILQAYVNGGALTDHCADLIGKEGYSFQWRSFEDAGAYTRDLYTRYRNENWSTFGQYLPAVGDVFNYMDSKVSYFVYLDDFFTTCANSGVTYTDDPSIRPTNVYWDSVPIISSVDGKIKLVDTYYKKDIKEESWDFSVIGKDGARSCSALIERLNSYGEAAKAEVEAKGRAAEEAAAKENCKTQALEGVGGDKATSITAQLEEAQAIIDDPEKERERLKLEYPDSTEASIQEMVDKIVARAEEVKKKIEEIQASGEYWEWGTGDKAGKVVCKAYPSVFGDDFVNDSGYTDLVGKLEIENITNSGGKDSELCYQADGIDSMSWVLCPMTTSMADAVEGISGMLDDWLSTDTKLYDENSGAKTAWEIFRNLANVIMIIILLVVIFSQLTGYGIDNYGIKRILPRLIAMAILINLSYIICQIAIDLSNVLGQGLNRLFSSIGQTIMANNGRDLAEVSFSYIITGLLAAAAGTASIAVVVIQFASGGGAMIIISLILALLVALVAVLLFFVMLGARMVIVIMFTALAPLAFACYVLPNTQSIFKKWWNIFKTALIIYPICGALYGMSDIIKAVIWADGNNVHLFMGIIAVCAPFIPFLILPQLLRGALSALGMIGGTIGMLGAGMRGGLQKGQKGLQDSAAYKSAKERQQRNQTAWGAGLYRNGQRKWDDAGYLLDKNGNRKGNRRVSGFSKFIRGGEVGMANARRQHFEDRNKRGFEDSIMSGAGFDAAAADMEAKESTRMVSAFESLLRNGQARLAGGAIVNTANAGSVGSYHREALARYQGASSQQERDEAMAQVKAAQNLLSKTDKGREEVTKNLEELARGKRAEGLNLAAGHLLGEFGDTYKAKNRGAHSLISDLSNDVAIDSIEAKIGDGTYDMAGYDKYTEETLAGADELALKRMVDSIESGRLTGENLADIQGTAQRALTKMNTGNLNVKPEVAKELEKIAGNTITIPHNTPSSNPPSSYTNGSGTGGGDWTDFADVAD